MSGDVTRTCGTSAAICTASPARSPFCGPVAPETWLRATRLSSPSASTCASASRAAPSLTDIIAMTAATPSTTPSTLSDVRSL